MQAGKRTPGRQKILSFIIGYWGTRHISPTIREISEGTGIRSTSTIHGHLKRMARDGLISRQPDKPRSICPLVNTDGSPRKMSLPHANCIMMEIDKSLAKDCSSGVLVIKDSAGKVTEIYETQSIKRIVAN